MDGQLNLFEVEENLKKSKKKKTDKESKKEVVTKEEKFFDETPEKKLDFYPIHRKANDMSVVMHKTFEDMLEKDKIVVAYVDYNIIYYKEKEKRPELIQFQSAKLAVDRYMEILEKLRMDEMLIEDEGDLVLEDV